MTTPCESCLARYFLTYFPSDTFPLIASKQTDRQTHKCTTHPSDETLHELSSILPEAGIDGDALLGDVFQMPHHSLVPEVVRKCLCPLTELTKRKDRLFRKKISNSVLKKQQKVLFMHHVIKSCWNLGFKKHIRNVHRAVIKPKWL